MKVGAALGAAPWGRRAEPALTSGRVGKCEHFPNEASEAFIARVPPDRSPSCPMHDLADVAAETVIGSKAEARTTFDTEFHCSLARSSRVGSSLMSARWARQQ